MATTVENQKVIIVSKAMADKNHPYSIINMEALNQAMTTLKGCDFMLWMYIAKNQNGYKFALSRTAFCRTTSYGRSAYLDAVQHLKDKGYLVQKGEDSNVYTFYELPEETDESQKTKDDLNIELPNKKIEEVKQYEF